MNSETVDRIVRIVDYNSNNTAQPDATKVTSIKQIAKHNQIPPEEAHAAINEAIEDGRLEVDKDRIRVAAQSV